MIQMTIASELVHRMSRVFPIRVDCTRRSRVKAKGLIEPIKWRKNIRKLSGTAENFRLNVQGGRWGVFFALKCESSATCRELMEEQK